MAKNRAYSASSLPRYALKMLRRMQSIGGNAVSVESITPNSAGFDEGAVATYAVAQNWVNGFYTYSQLRYSVLPILDQYGIPRSMSYIFMAMVQHAYKEYVVKKNASLEEIAERSLTMVIGNTDEQHQFWGDKLGDVTLAVNEILQKIGVPVEQLGTTPPTATTP